LTKLSDKVDAISTKRVSAEEVLIAMKPYLDTQLQLLNELKEDVGRLEKRIDDIALYRTPEPYKISSTVKLSKVEQKMLVLPADIKNMSAPAR
jgi:hypothetical protein